MNQEAEKIFCLDNTNNNSNLSKYNKNEDSIYSWANRPKVRERAKMAK